jgi:hypothetical protein
MNEDSKACTMKINDKQDQTKDKDKDPTKGRSPVHYFVSIAI